MVLANLPLSTKMLSVACANKSGLDEPPLLVFVWLYHTHSANPGGNKRVAEATLVVAAMPYSHPPTCGTLHRCSDTRRVVDEQNSRAREDPETGTGW